MERIGFGARHRNLSPPPVSSPFSNEKGEEECRAEALPPPTFSSPPQISQISQMERYSGGGKR